jgi:Ca-activated chloride channel family protein
VIVLLSDGENNFGKRSPIEAAELAKEWGIKIYAIAIGGGEAVTSIQTPFGTYKVPSSRGLIQLRSGSQLKRQAGFSVRRTMQMP